jgi:hypothetical protein
MATCPQCLGNMKLMDFRPGNRVTGEAAGWKAVDCPQCQGVGEVTEERAATIEKKIAGEAEEVTKTKTLDGRRLLADREDHDDPPP